ncbi:MAG: iron ABC transporter permease [Thermoplasmata archaeon]|nr:iron ABC transporter permease [Thermoplasmata archaeon]MCI4344211.1 iron ABC transporter permease [Thermoplasmata archaeon]
MPPNTAVADRVGRSRFGGARVAALIAALAGLALLSCFVGTISIPPSVVATILLHQSSNGALLSSNCPASVSAFRCDAFTSIVWDLRVPAVLLALTAGAALGLAGGTLQGVFRNPLADPYLFGLSSGAAVGAAALFVFNVGVRESNLTLPLFAFLGAVLTGAAILAIAGGRFGSIETLLLSGVALSYLLSGILSLMLLYNPFGSFQVSFWLLGGLTGATWDRVGVAFGGLLVAGSFLVIAGREVNVLQLGDEVAKSLGVEVSRVRTRLILLASLATGFAVAFTGVIGFVGLVSPHIVRRLFSADYRVVLPGSALVGGLFMLGASDLAQSILPQTVLPVGVLTAFAGAPFFLFLLQRRRRRAPRGD